MQKTNLFQILDQSDLKVASPLLLALENFLHPLTQYALCAHFELLVLVFMYSLQLKLQS